MDYTKKQVAVYVDPRNRSVKSINRERDALGILVSEGVNGKEIVVNAVDDILHSQLMRACSSPEYKNFPQIYIGTTRIGCVEELKIAQESGELKNFLEVQKIEKEPLHLSIASFGPAKTDEIKKEEPETEKEKTSYIDSCIDALSYLSSLVAFWGPANEGEKTTTPVASIENVLAEVEEEEEEEKEKKESEVKETYDEPEKVEEDMENNVDEEKDDESINPLDEKAKENNDDVLIELWRTNWAWMKQRRLFKFTSGDTFSRIDPITNETRKEFPYNEMKRITTSTPTSLILEFQHPEKYPAQYLQTNSEEDAENIKKIILYKNPLTEM